jgi:hypothetical protein
MEILSFIFQLTIGSWVFPREKKPQDSSNACADHLRLFLVAIVWQQCSCLLSFFASILMMSMDDNMQIKNIDFHFG